MFRSLLTKVKNEEALLYSCWFFVHERNKRILIRPIELKFPHKLLRLGAHMRFSVAQLKLAVDQQLPQKYLEHRWFTGSFTKFIMVS